MFFIDDNNKVYSKKVNVDNETPSKLKKIKRFFKKYGKFFGLGLGLVVVAVITLGVINKIEELRYLKNHDHVYENGTCEICGELEVYYAEFIDGDGETIKVPYTIETKKIEQPEATTKLGYNSSWKEEVTLDGTKLYTVEYTPVEYRVTYHIPLDGVENNPLNKTSYNIESSKSTLESLEVEGYTFVGWYESSDYTKPVSTLDPTKLSNIDLYAKFIPNKTTIVLYPNGAKESSIKLYVNANESISLTNDYFTKYGHTFIGWSETGTNDKILENGFVYNATLEEEVISYFAMWKQNETTIIYKSNDETVKDITQVLKSSETITLVNTNFKKEACTLVGYSLTENGTIDFAIGQQYRANENSETVYLYPVFIKNQNRIIFNASGASEKMDDIFVDSLSTVSLPINSFVKSGDTAVFLGWSTIPNGEVVYKDGDEYTATIYEETINLYAIWTQNAEITLHFDENGGESSIELKDIVCGLNETVELPTNGLTKTGKTFIGWSLSSDGELMYTNAYSYNQKILVDTITLYAVYDTNKTIIKFNSNGAQGTMPDMTIMAGKQAILSENLFTKEGFTFVGWSLEIDNSTIKYYNATPYTAGLEPNVITLYPVFERNKTIINFNNNGGYGTINSMTVESLDTVQLPNSGFSITDKNFTGYSLEPNGELVYKVGGEFTATNKNETITLYAVYEKNFNMVILNSNNGKEETKELKVYYDEKKNLPKNTFSKELYTFIGWSYAIDGEVAFNDEALYTPTLMLENINLYAIYRINVTELNFYYEDAEIQINSINVNADNKITLPDNIYYKQGYKFIGWTDSIIDNTVKYENNGTFTGSKFDDTVTLYPVFSRNHTTVNFNSNGGKGAVESLYLESLTDYELPMNLFTRAGYKFIGWSLTESNESIYSEGYVVKTSEYDSEMLYYAIWEENEKVLTLYYNNGTEDYEVIENFNVSSGDIITLEPTYKDYVFLGWNTDKDAETALYTSNKKFIIEPMSEYVLYAIYGEMQGTNGLVYNLFGSGENQYYTITGYKGLETTVIIPTTLNEIRVKYIADYAFKDNTTIVNIELPKHCISIGKNAFENCTNLVNVTLNENLETINEYAFRNTKLDTITIPSNVTEIKKGTFSNSTLNKITLPESITLINESAFENCTNLETINLNNIVTISDKAFSNCTKLNNLTLTNIKTIGNQAFLSNESLKDITLGENLEEIGLYAFKNTIGLKTLNLPSSLKKINNGAFVNSGILSVTLKENIELLGSEAFKDSSLKEVIIESLKLTYINKETFKNSDIEKVTLSTSIKKLFNGAFSDCKNLYQINLTNVEDIYENVFKNCTSLSEDIYLYSIKNIKENAFYNTTNLLSILVGENLNTISSKAFDKSSLTLIYLYNTSDTDYLNKVGTGKINVSTNPYVFILENDETIPSDVKYYWHFDENNKPVYRYQITVKLHGGSLTGNSEHTSNVFIPSNHTLTSVNDIVFGTETKFIVDDYTFIGWSLTEDGDMIYRDNETIDINISKKVFDLYAVYQLTSLNSYYSFTKVDGGYSLTGITNKDYIKNLETIEIPKYYNYEKVVEIGTSVFNGYTVLKNIILPNSIKKIGDYAFKSTGLTSLDIKENIETIEQSAFANCQSLQTINIESKYINKNAFTGNIELISITFKNTVEIKEGAFKTCPKLTNFLLPETLLYIGNEAFSGDTKITKVSMPSSLISIGDYAFYSASSLSNISLNNGLESIGEYAFANTIVTKVVIPMTCTLVKDNAFSNSSLQIIRLENSLDDSTDKAFSGVETINQLFISKDVSSITNKFDNAIVKELYYDNPNYAEFIISGFNPTKAYYYKASAPEALLSNDNMFFKYDSYGLPVIYRFTQFTVNYHYNGIVDSRKQQTMDKYINLININYLDLNYDAQNAREEFVGWGYDSIDVAYDKTERIQPLESVLNLYAVCGYLDQNYTVEPIYENDKEEKVIAYQLVNYTGDSTNIIFPDYFKNTDYSNLYIKVTSINGSESNHLLNNNVKSIEFNKYITEIPDYAFYFYNKSNSLNNIKLTDIITTIGSHAFYNVKIDSINLENVVTLKENSFNHVEINSKLELNKLTNYNFYSFNNILLTTSDFTINKLNYVNGLSIIKQVKNITLTSDITSIPSAMFYRFYNLKTITALGVKTIETNAFRNCESLEYAYFDNIETVGEYAFYGCKNLKEIAFKGYINHISSFAFYSCTNLKKVVIDGRNSSGVTIDEYAFGNIVEIKDLVTSGNYHSLNRRGFESTKIKNIYLIDDSISKIAEYGLDDNGTYKATIYKLYSEKPTTIVQAWNGNYDPITIYELNTLIVTYDLENEVGVTLNGSAIENSNNEYVITLLSTISNTYTGYTLLGWSKTSDTSHRIINYSLGETITVHPNDNLVLYPVYASNTNNGAIIETYTDGGKTYAKVKGFTSNSSGNYVIPNYTKEGYKITKVKNGSFDSLEEFDLTLNDFIDEIEEFAFDGAKIKNLYNTDNIIKVGSYSFRNTSYLNSITFKNLTSILDGAFNTAMKDGTKLVFESPITYFESMDFWKCKATITLTTGFDGKTKKIDELLNGAKVDTLVISENYEVEELDLHNTLTIDTLIIKSDYIKSFKDQTLTTNINNLILGKNMTISANMFIGSSDNSVTLSNKVVIYFTEDRQQYKVTPGLSNSNCNFRFMSDDSNVNSKYDIYDSNFNKRTIDWTYRYANPWLITSVYVIGNKHRVLTYGEAYSNPEASSIGFTCWNYTDYNIDYESQRSKLNSCYSQFTPNSIITNNTIWNVIRSIANYSDYLREYNNHVSTLYIQDGISPVTYTTKLNSTNDGLIITNISDLKVLAITIPNYLNYGGSTYPVVGIEMSLSNSYVHSLYIPESVTSISPYAFSNYTNLQHVSIDAKLSSIPVGIFENCPINDFSMGHPELVTTISNYAFTKATYIDLSMFTNLKDIGTSFQKLQYSGELVFKDMTGMSNFRYSPIERITFTGKISPSCILQCTNLKKVVVKSTADLQGCYFGAIKCENFYFEKDMSLEGYAIFDGGSVENLYLNELSTKLDDQKLLHYNGSVAISNLYYKGTLDDMLAKIDIESNILKNTTFYYLDNGVFTKYERPEYLKVTFVNINDDSDVLYEEFIKRGSSVVYPYNQPFKYDDTYVYQFIGWNESLNNITKDVIIKPITLKVLRSENGEYPTSLVTDTSIITALDNITETDSNGYKTYNNEKYLAYNGGAYIDNNGNEVAAGVHYYKVEPIRWRFLSSTTDTESGKVTEIFVVSEYLIDWMPYNTDFSETRTDYQGNTNTDTIYINNYQYSTIRSWLNTDFLSTAFKSTDQIKVTELDNGDTTANIYASEVTNDKVFLLDNTTLFENYFYDTKEMKTRNTTTTEYARAIYAKVGETNLLDTYWTRTAYETGPNFAYHIARETNLSIWYGVNETKGVRPALSFIVSIED